MAGHVHMGRVGIGEIVPKDQSVLTALSAKITAATGDIYWTGTEHAGGPGDRPRYHLADGLAMGYQEAINQAQRRCVALGIDISAI